ncbi:hypothetical protein [Lamprocystis purpurea]|jgi:hypothetical protein|uniref:hypothetical protein n=1 Tax=Lamprocystis purpurea TaxID=61598 RepID=UPI0003777D3C|nr:hypothetical protein [Lamprocystis purpurea]
MQRFLAGHCRLGWMVLIPLASLADGGMTPQPVVKLGTCPSGYSTSGQYCIPGPRARLALEKRGRCPSAYGTSGAYCLAGSQARPALPKIGAACPSQWSTSGDYCLLNH